MKIAELIRELQTIQRVHGNIDVCVPLNNRDDLIVPEIDADVAYYLVRRPKKLYELVEFYDNMDSDRAEFETDGVTVLLSPSV